MSRATGVNTAGAGRGLIILCKWPLNQLPPVVTVALVMSKLVQGVTIVCLACPPRLREILASAGVEVVAVEPTDRGFHVGKWARLVQWLRFHQVACDALRSAPHSIVWLGSGDTALAIGHGALRGRHFVLHLHELYDNNWFYRALLGWFARRASCVVVPEASRGAILRGWFSLRRSPKVFPNKPAFHPESRGQPIGRLVPEHIARELQRRDMKIVLYQGHIGHKRDLSTLAQAVTKLGAPWRLVLMGYDHDSYVPELQRLCPNLIHVAHIDPPEHLGVTSWAYVGAVSYSHASLNNIFCAPNKIWEYTGFGIPVIGNDLPGLVNTVAANGAGMCVDWDEPDKIVRGLRSLDDNYAKFSGRAKQFFESCDLPQIADSILNAA